MRKPAHSICTSADQTPSSPKSKKEQMTYSLHHIFNILNIRIINLFLILFKQKFLLDFEISGLLQILDA